MLSLIFKWNRKLFADGRIFITTYELYVFHLLKERRIIIINLTSTHKINVILIYNYKHWSRY